MAASIVLGTVQFGLDYGINNKEGKPGDATVNEIFEEAYRSGIRKLDTAEMYGNAQERIGSFHKKQNIRFDINTKFKGAKEGLRANLDKNLEELFINKVDTYFYHSFSDYTNYPRLLAELGELKKEGLINRIGVSVYDNNELTIVTNDNEVDVIQLPFNLLDNASQRGVLLKKAKAAGKLIQVRSVFLQGLFFKAIETLPSFLLPLAPYLKELHKLSDDAGLSMESLCMLYASAQTFIDEIIIGVDTRQQLLDNLRVLQNELDQQIVQKIDTIAVKETPLLYPFNWK